MAKKQYFALVDTETTIESTVADLAVLIVDRKGQIFNQIAVLIQGEFGVKKLFYDVNSSEEIWTLKGLEQRNQTYKNMLNSGQRMLASVNAVNKWFNQAHRTYPDLIFTAYNSSFDRDKMIKTGIDLEGFADRDFCLWRASVDRLKGNKAFIQHCLDRKWMTAKFNLRTNAESVAEFVNGYPMEPEPHTALEDAKDYELPILKWLLKYQSWKKYGQQGYSWYDWQLHKLVTPK